MNSQGNGEKIGFYLERKGWIERKGSDCDDVCEPISGASRLHTALSFSFSLSGRNINIYDSFTKLI